jgi:hypothetical protein
VRPPLCARERALAIFELVREFRLRVALAQQQQQQLQLQLVQSSKMCNSCSASFQFVSLLVLALLNLSRSTSASTFELPDLRQRWLEQSLPLSLPLEDFHLWILPTPLPTVLSSAPIPLSLSTSRPSPPLQFMRNSQIRNRSRNRRSAAIIQIRNQRINSLSYR